eukprot:GHVU01219440.1.p3 GENE.GHVU01219440.1~~GHVU01219440.1.p3  ORF type:complete len:104 (-),score=5.81 GHVU01219440.1:593-904(-)
MCAYADFAYRLMKQWQDGKLERGGRVSDPTITHRSCAQLLGALMRHFNGSGWAEASPCSIPRGRSDDSVRGIDIIHIREMRECVSTAGLTDLEARSPLEEAST